MSLKGVSLLNIGGTERVFRVIRSIKHSFVKQKQIETLYMKETSGASRGTGI